MKSPFSKPGARHRPQSAAGPVEAIATISELDQEVRGVARVDGKVMFIDGALPGEQVRVRIRQRKRSFDLAEVAEVLTPSPHRVTPPCQYAGRCGGCGMQHLSIDQQIHYKEQILHSKLQEFGAIKPEHWLPPLQGAAHGYRRRARLGVRVVPKKGGVLIGFRERNSSYLTVMDQCQILDARASALILPLKQLVARLSFSARLPQIELAAGDEALALIFRHLLPATEADRQLLQAFGRTHDVQVYLQPQGPDALERLWPLTAAQLSYHLPEFSVEFIFTPTSFIQVNADMNRRMVSQALALMAPQPGERIADLFCGLGNFTLPLARHARHVVGYETNETLLQRARDNARHNGLDNVEFRRADLYDETVSADIWPDGDFDKVLLDPPRDGAMQVLKRLPRQAPRRIVYVSCNPVTLARDAQYLVSVRGYRMTQAGVMDMFPHTAHVESMAVFER